MTLTISKGQTQAETAKLFGIGETTIKEWKRRIKANESLEPKIRQRLPKKLPPEELRAFAAAYSDAYLIEISQHFNCSITSVRKALLRLKITRKKRRQPIVNETNQNEQNLSTIYQRYPMRALYILTLTMKRV